MDRLAAKAAFAAPLAAANRVFYVTDGMATLATPAAVATLAPNSAFYSGRTADVAAGAEGAGLLRYELVTAGTTDDGIAAGDGVSSELLLEAELELDAGAAYLMRCDRVDIPPGGTAYSHTHRGPGIRCLLEGGSTSRSMARPNRSPPGKRGSRPGPMRCWRGRARMRRGTFRG